ncbi:MAG: two-component system, response regulator PdtaR [Sphingomonadales bacterium]|jgi:DNA-binding NarL/FixJ family response regulator|nr:two-component system, response regulator PdtaR [Sphingomonadales bacterium]
MFTRLRTIAEAMLIEGSEAPEGSAEPIGQSAPREAPEPAAGPCILLVEDDFLVGMEVETGLEEAGYEVAGIASTAEEAVELARARGPALVVMDIRLAGERDGVDAALEIFRTLGIRSLFASAHGDAQIRARAEAARPLGWVAKPYRVETLLKAIEAALGEV